MRPASETFLRTLTAGHRSEARLMVLDPLTFDVRAVLSGEDGYTLEGTVNMSRNRTIRRTCEVVIANPGGSLTPRVLGDLLHVNSLIRLERGVYLDPDTPEWMVLGHFLLGRPRVEVLPFGATVAVQGEDRAKLLVRSRFTVPTTYAAGTRLAHVFATEAGVAGMGSTRYRLDDLGKTLSRSRTFEEDEVRSEELVGLARDYGLELYVDADGFLACGPPPDPVSAPIAWSFAPGDTAIMLGITKEWTDDRLYNHVIVTGESADPSIPLVRAERMDTNPASPAYINGPLGDRLYRYTSPMITSAAQAAEVAASLLPEVALLEESISLPTVPNPTLEPGDAITISEPLSATEDRYLIESIALPLGLGEQTLETRIARPLT